MSGFSFVKEMRKFRRTSEQKEFASVEEFVQKSNGNRVIKTVSLILSRI